MDYRQNLTRGGNALNAAIGGNTPNAGNAGGNTDTAAFQDWQARLRVRSSGVSIRSSASQTYTEIKQQTISYIFDLLFAGWKKDISLQPITPAQGQQMLSLAQETYFEESESTSFSTTGTVKTSDGREIQFNVNVGMSRTFREYYREDLNLASFSFCDPLVINLDTDVAQLEDQTFYFDIDGDGEKDEVARLGAGSGYLALDKNGDGIINDGTELFGTKSGSGFADLAGYDEDGNGWIDENDDIWDKLRIWTKDENGKDVLCTLAEKNVGAICLQNAATDFTGRGTDGKVLGAIRSTGVFLYENGSVGTMQHVDVAKYEKMA